MLDSGTRVVWAAELFDERRVGQGFSRTEAGAKSIAALAAGGTVFVPPPSRRPVGVSLTAIDRIKDADNCRVGHSAARQDLFQEGDDRFAAGEKATDD
jgi:hypothetical protein